MQFDIVYVSLLRKHKPIKESMLLTATADETNKRSAMHISLYLNIDSPLLNFASLFLVEYDQPISFHVYRHANSMYDFLA